MRLYHIKILTYGGDTWNWWARNMKEARKLRTRLKKEFKENIREIYDDSYEVPRNKDGLIDLLNDVT